MKVILAAIVLVLMPGLAFSMGAPENAARAAGGGGTQLITMLVTFFLIWLVPSALLSLIPASIARGKGRRFARWWVYGWFLFLIALIHSICIKGRRCPYCAEQIRSEATVCRFCGRDLRLVQNVSQ
jgi:hypothetical protein